MNEDIREFLNRFTIDDLEARQVLFPFGFSREQYLLRAGSVSPLIELMKEHNISRLEYPSRNWWLDSEYQFNNPRSEENKTGDARRLSNPGSVFNEQNRYINPFFKPAHPEPEDDSSNQSLGAAEAAAAVTFGLERDLQSALRGNIEQLEPGLKIVDGGAERTAEAGRIDITAEDAEGRLVVIELKAHFAQPGDIAQVLAYMGTISDDEQKPVRGILVAHGFHRRIVWAAQAVPNLQLKEYSFRFLFSDR